MGDHSRRDVRLIVREAATLAPECELDRKTELADINPAGKERQILRQQRPSLAQLVRRPHLLHTRTPPPALKPATLRVKNGTRHLRWPKRTASGSLGLMVRGGSVARHDNILSYRHMAVAPLYKITIIS